MAVGLDDGDGGNGERDAVLAFLFKLLSKATYVIAKTDRGSDDGGRRGKRGGGSGMRNSMGNGHSSLTGGQRHGSLTENEDVCDR